ncbi:hypothetical protein [Circo-like virus Croatia 17_S17]|nr:hypothetical protein [Circo-like virus Croatia 17_S17]
MHSSIWDDIEDEEFFKLDDYDYWVDEASLIRSTVLTEAIKEIKGEKETVKWRLEDMNNIIKIREVSTVVRLFCHNTATRLRVNWSDRSWKGWAIEKRAWTLSRGTGAYTTRERSGGITDLQRHRKHVYFMKGEIWRMLDNLEQLCKRHLKSM